MNGAVWPSNSHWQQIAKSERTAVPLGRSEGVFLLRYHVVGSVREVLARDSPNRKKHADEERISSSTVQTLARPSTKAGYLTHSRGDSNTPPNLSGSLTSEDCTVDTREVIEPEPNR